MRTDRHGLLSTWNKIIDKLLPAMFAPVCLGVSKQDRHRHILLQKMPLHSERPFLLSQIWSKYKVWHLGDFFFSYTQTFFWWKVYLKLCFCFLLYIFSLLSLWLLGHEGYVMNIRMNSFAFTVLQSSGFEQIRNCIGGEIYDDIWIYRENLNT